MPSDIKITGIVLSAAPMDDKDLRLAVLSREAGTIPVLAKGALSAKSKWRSVSQPFSLVHMVLSRGQSFYYIKEAELSDSLYEIRSDLDRVAWGSLMLEVARDFSVDGADNRALVNLLARGLIRLARPGEGQEPSRLASVFLWRLLAENGYEADPDHCRSCGIPREPGDERSWGFLPQEGGLLCPDCERLHPAPYRISGRTAERMKAVQTAPPQKLFELRLEDEEGDELRKVSLAYLDCHSGQTYRSLEFIKSLN